MVTVAEALELDNLYNAVQCKPDMMKCQVTGEMCSL